jgi:trehalose synthase
MLQSVNRLAGPHVIILPVDNRLLVNALQRRARVVLQKSIREGFGLTVSEAMWKGRPVIGGNVGGIRRQIMDGETGFLVDDAMAAAERIKALLVDQSLRRRLGRRAKERVRRHFLMSRLLDDCLTLLTDLMTGRARSVRTLEPAHLTER